MYVYIYIYITADAVYIIYMHTYMPSINNYLREKYIFCVPRELQRLLSLFCLWEESVGGA